MCSPVSLLRLFGTTTLIVYATLSDTTDDPGVIKYFCPIFDSTGIKCRLSIQNFNAGLHKELFSAPSGEQPTCLVAKVRIGEENCSSVRAFGMTWTQSYILMLRAYEHAHTLLQFSSPILALATSQAGCSPLGAENSSLCSPALMDWMSVKYLVDPLTVVTIPESLSQVSEVLVACATSVVFPILSFLFLLFIVSWAWAYALWCLFFKCVAKFMVFPLV